MLFRIVLSVYCIIICGHEVINIYNTWCPIVYFPLNSSRSIFYIFFFIHWSAWLWSSLYSIGTQLWECQASKTHCNFLLFFFWDNSNWMKRRWKTLTWPETSGNLLSSLDCILECPGSSSYSRFSSNEKCIEFYIKFRLNIIFFLAGGIAGMRVLVPGLGFSRFSLFPIIIYSSS